MKIIHICIFSSFTENMGYQENLISDIQAKDGHEVTVISNCSYFYDGVLINSLPEDKYLPNGIRLIRTPLVLNFYSSIAQKIGKTYKIKELIEEISPDVIIFHGIQGFELITVADYIKKNPKAKLFLDTHADNNNCNLNIIGRFIYYRLIMQLILRRILPLVSKIFYISTEAGDFARKEFNIPETKLEFLPLGGFPADPEYKKIVTLKIRNQYQIPLNNKVFVHSGKFNIEKKNN